MATSPWYREGTAKFTKGSTTVTGTGTRWVDFVRAGDGIQGPDGKLYQVTNVASDTSLSITPAYGSATTYWTIPVQGYVKQLADAAAQLVRDFEGEAAEAVDAADRAKQSATEAKASEIAAEGFKNSASASAKGASASETAALFQANRAESEANRAEEAANEALKHVSSFALMQKQIVDIDWVIPSGYNALVIGDLNVNPGVTVTGVGSATLRGI